MSQRISFIQMQHVLSAARHEGLLDDKDSAVVFYDLDLLENRLNGLIEAFPKGTLHAVAIKANPLRKILEFVAGFGLGLEAASLPELHLALAAGVPANRIVFDSPAKTQEELAFALESGVIVNVDNFEELARIAAIMQSSYAPCIRNQIGLRINPQVGQGTIATTSVAGVYSKFGIPIVAEDQILDAYQRYPWLNGIHLHVGSQGCGLELLTDGVVRIHKLAQKINRMRPQHPLTFFDLGGGLPVQYRVSDQPISIMDYVKRLESKTPDLFNGTFRAITEFGRYIHANAAWAVSRVEYVKSLGSMPTAITHLGADMFLRECYDPKSWHHEIAPTSADGQLKSGPTQRYHIAGPLCFASDVISYRVALPQLEAGDFLLIRDVGAYTSSMWSRYNSRPMPKFVGYRRKSEQAYAWQLLKDREKVEDVVSFWS